MSDTIAAIASGLTGGGINIIRVSGDASIDIVKKIFVPKSGIDLTDAKTYTVHYGCIIERDDEKADFSYEGLSGAGCSVVDEVIVLLMKAPRSYTKEDVVEIDCHGGILVTERILNLLLSKGARPAEAGEFTKRAFLNGRIDLTEAEAVMEVINSKNNLALQNSVKHLHGDIKERIIISRNMILDEIAFIEASLDDPENYEDSSYSTKLRGRLSRMIEDIDTLLSKSQSGRRIENGISTVILGKPNVGKSSIWNLLVGNNRAIVTDIPGTTRDVLEENVQIGDVSIRLMDTAGIHETDNMIEKIGIQKAIEAAKNAELILFIYDASSSLAAEDVEFIKNIGRKEVIVIANKLDLVDNREAENFNMDDVIMFSAKEKIGLDALESKIKELFISGKVDFNNDIVMTNERHLFEFRNAAESLKQVIISIDMGMSEDFYTNDLTDAYKALGRIIGEDENEDVIQNIFGRFCIGK